MSADEAEFGLNSTETPMDELHGNRSCDDHLRSCGEDRRDLGHFMHEPIAEKWFVTFVHQLSLWTGTFHQGKALVAHEFE